MKDDGYFKSINITGRWYKDDPFIMATDATQVFFLEDTKLGPCWRVLQEFGHQHIFDVEESDTNQPIHEQVQMRSQEAYQEEHISSIDGAVRDIPPDIDLLDMDNEPGSLLVETSSRASIDKNILLKVMKQTAKMKMKPTLSTIVQKKAILQEKTMMLIDLCISRHM
jgi:hypothetical protein